MKPKPIYERLRAFLLCFALLAGMLPVTAFAATNVQYIDADGTTNTCANATDVTSSTTSWSTGWYVVNSEVTISTRITVNGVVNLILGDNATLNANAGITVAQSNSLTIYAQENGTGKLIATAQSSSGNTGSNAGIGGTGSGGIGGAVTIYGGTVTATGGTAEYGGSGAGIGGAGGEGGEGGIGAIGSNGGAGGTVTIYGGTVTATGGAGQAGGGAGIGGGGGGGGVNSDNGDPQCATGGAGGAGGSVTIYGGTVTATSKTIRHSGSGAGIGGGGGSSGKTAGGKGGDCAPVAITGGLVTAKSGDTGIGGSGAGIGGGGGGSNFDLSAIADSGNPGTFSTQGGNAVIFASSGNGFHSGAAIGASETAVWSGVIFQGKAGTVYGDQTIEEDFTLEQGYTLTVPQNTTLTIPKGVTLTNRGTINGPGKLTGSGTVTNSGSISVSVNDFAVSVDLSITSGGSTVTSVTYGSTVTLTATVTKNSGNVTDGTVTFYRGAATGIPLNSTPANVTDGTAKYELALKGDDWKPGDTAYTITAVYTPASSSNLLSGSGTGILTVSKASQGNAPDAPSVSTDTQPTANSITLNTVTGSGQGAVQYACVEGSGTGITAPTDDDDWQTETVFDSLQAGTAYTFFARYAGNNFYDPSPASSGTTIYTAYAAPTGTEGYSINYSDETVTATSGYEVKLSNSDTWTASGTALSISPGGTFQVRHAATENGSPASDAATVNVAERPDAPDLKIDTEAEGVEISSEYYYNTTGADYSAEGWTQGNGSLVPVDPEGTIYIYAAATGSAFKSAVQTLAAPARGTAPTLPTIDYKDESLSGTNTGMEYGIAMGQSVPSQWQGCSADMSLTSFGWDGSEQVTVYFRTAATDDSYASAPTTEALTIPARPAAPDAPEVSDKTDTSITITAETGVQYRLGDSDDWQSGTDGSLTFDNLTAGTEYTIYARYPAVTGDTPAFASAEAKLKVTTKTSAGEAPTVGEATVTANSITLPYNAAWEYRMESGDWGSAYQFSGLTPATEYTFYVRVAETTTAEASQEAEVKVYTAYTAPETGEGYSINYTEETITVDSGYEVNTAQGFDGTIIPEGSITSYIGQPLYIRRAADEDGAPASAGTAIPLTRPAAPAVQGVNETVQGREDGKITGLTAGVGYEISDDSGQSWKNAELTGTEITGLAPGSYQVRVKSTDTSFTGEAASVTISTGAEPTYILNVTAPTFDSVYTGYAQPEAKAITISSAGNSDATISGVTVDNASFVIGGSGSTVPAGGSISTWTIRPAAGLSVGTYTATITVAYNDGTTAAAQVSFTVTRRPSSGGGGTTPSNPTYTPGVTEPENGAVTVTPEKPKAGDTVTITAEPAERYKVDSVTVTDEDGDPVDVTVQEDGTYTFTQPEGDVTITVTFDVDMPFTDVPEGAWYIEGAKYVYGNFIMSGTSPTTFSPSTPVSRGMIMQILYNMVGQPDVEGDSNFTDVDEDYWSADAIAWAVANGVAGGFGDGTFRPDEGLTREQMAVVLRNFAYQMGWDISASGDLSRFTDIPEDSWARDALAWAFAVGLLTGTSDTTMAPTGEASRAQIAVIMMRFCQRYIDNVE